jgi:hypothetical protein
MKVAPTQDATRSGLVPKRDWRKDRSVMHPLEVKSSQYCCFFAMAGLASSVIQNELIFQQVTGLLGFTLLNQDARPSRISSPSSR